MQAICHVNVLVAAFIKDKFILIIFCLTWNIQKCCHLTCHQYKITEIIYIFYIKSLKCGVYFIFVAYFNMKSKFSLEILDLY